MEKLIQVAMEIVAENPQIIVSGSLALRKMGYKTRREPQDIDLFLPKGVSFNLLKDMEYIDDSGTYNGDDFQRRSFKYKDVRIDVFQPEHYKDYFAVVDNSYAVFNREPALNLLSFPAIMAFKIQHALDFKYPDQKHKEDIIWFLNNNGPGSVINDLPY